MLRWRGHYRSATMAEQRSTGVGLLRQVLDWTNVETSPGHYDFTVYDGFMREAAAHGIAVLPVLFNPPPFYRRDTGRAACPAAASVADGRLRASGREALRPRRLALARAAVRAKPPRPLLADLERAQPRDLLVQSPERASVREHAARRRQRRSRARTPARRSSTAGLPDSKLKSAMPLDRFITRLYRAHGKRYFDTLAINGYATGQAQLSELLHRVRRRMNRHRDRRAASGSPRWAGATSARPTASSSARPGRRHGSRARSRCSGSCEGSCACAASSTTPGVTARPYPPLYKDMWGLHTGLLDVNGNPKPAFGAFSQAVAALR